MIKLQPESCLQRYHHAACSPTTATINENGIPTKDVVEKRKIDRTDRSHVDEYRQNLQKKEVMKISQRRKRSFHEA